MRPALVGEGGAGADHSLTFVAPAALDDGLARAAGPATGPDARCARPARSPRPTWSTTTPCRSIEVDPESFAIRIDGELVEPAPATELPLAQRYSLF